MWKWIFRVLKWIIIILIISLVTVVISVIIDRYNSFFIKYYDWVIGIAFSLLVGHFVTAYFLVRLRRYLLKREQKDKKFSLPKKIRVNLGIDFYPPINDPSKKHIPERHIPPWILGPVERLFFTIIIACNVGGAAIAMVTWIGLKMLSRREHREEVLKFRRLLPELPFEYTALFGNLSSMFFALIGGLIIKEYSASDVFHALGDFFR